MSGTQTHQNDQTSDLQSFANELDALKRKTLSSVGAKDERYIRRLIASQRLLDLTSRVLIPLAFLFFDGAFMWILATLGTLGLGISKILDNMEIGHNVLHGQYDWMNDPRINSQQFEWDNAGDSGSWKRYHNYEHHTYTNVLGKDRDFGYGILRMSHDLPWRLKNLWQFLSYLKLSALFEWGIAYHELAGERIFIGKRKEHSELPISRSQLKRNFFSKAAKQITKDYIVYPLIFWPVALPVLACALIANLIRNLWTSTIIFCGHFTEDAEVFYENEINGETKGQWYRRQILGSSNIKGSKLFHLLSGHLSFQIEHHLFPNIPAPHYQEMAPHVKRICEKHGIPYNSDYFLAQYSGVLKRILHHSLPEKANPTQNAL